MRKYIHKLKFETLSVYSKGIPTCTNPFGEHEKPYTNLISLSIDHINGGGRKQRTEGTGGQFYRWLRKQGYPSGFQVLCMNCQYIKRWENGEFRKPVAQVS
jgi:hypothetical protein